MNEEIIERVMRMGIEHRSGISYDALFDLARKEIKASKNRIQGEVPFDEWKSRSKRQLRYAMIKINGVLQIVKFLGAAPSDFKFVRWVTPTMPEVTR
jgi:hypothetical protein